MRMTKDLAIAAGMLLVMASAGMVFAQPGDEIVAKVPFQFTVRDRVLPAGEYEIFAPDLGDPTSLVARETKGSTEETFVTEPVDNVKPAAKSELVFDQIGNRRFLRQIWVEGEHTGRQIALCKTEKQLQMNGQKTSEHRLDAHHSMHHQMSKSG